MYRLATKRNEKMNRRNREREFLLGYSLTLWTLVCHAQWSRLSI